MKLTEENKWAWVAAILEGEGSIVMGVDKRSNFIICRTHVEMTDEDVIDTLHSIAGGNKSGPYNYSKKPSWRWSINKKNDLYHFLIAVRPFMHSRRTEKIDLVLEHLKFMGYPK